MWLIFLSLIGFVHLLAIFFIYTNHHNTLDIAKEAKLTQDDREQMPSVLVIVPARNEETNIANCLKALLASEYTNFRIRVVDDCSTDKTFEIISKIAEHDLRIEVISIKKLPEGWLGKNHANWVGSLNAEEDYLLFIDADLQVNPSCLMNTVIVAEKMNADLLTMMPKVETKTFWEQVVQPIVTHSINAFISIKKVNDPKNKLAVGIGPFMLFRQKAYQKIGGHKEQRQEVVEDKKLAEAIKQAGLRLIYSKGTDQATIKMYDSLDSIIRGWPKNFHVAFGNAWWIAPFLSIGFFIFYGLPYLLPFIILCTSNYQVLSISLLVVITVFLGRLQFSIFYGMTLKKWYLAPLGSIIVSWIIFRAMLHTTFNRPLNWKDRQI